jgi:hypothetical protein
MNKELEKLWEKIECKFDKVTSANNKLVWFTMTSAVGMLGNLLMNLLG